MINLNSKIMETQDALLIERPDNTWVRVEAKYLTQLGWNGKIGKDTLFNDSVLQFISVLPDESTAETNKLNAFYLQAPEWYIPEVAQELSKVQAQHNYLLTNAEEK